MSVLTDFYGKLSIPDIKRGELEERALELMRRGGLARLEHVSMLGHDIELLCQPEWNEGEKAIISYSYFGEYPHDTCSFDKTNLTFSGDSDVRHEFRAVIKALAVLAEFYSEDFVISCFDGDVSDAQCAIGWLNHLFKEYYTNKRVENLNRIYHLMCDKTAGHLAPYDMSYLTRISIGGRSREMVENALEYLLNEGIYIKRSNERVSPTETAKDYVVALRAIKASAEMDDTEKIEILKTEFIKLNTATLKPINEFISTDVTVGIYSLPRDFTIKVFADTFGLDRNILAEELKDAPSDISHIWYNPDGIKPIPAIKTGIFIGNITDDDLAFFWRQDSNDVVFSEEMENWIAELKNEFEGIVVSHNVRPALDFLEEFMRALEDANKQFVHIYAHREIFFEFVERMNDGCVQAAIILLRRIMDRNQPLPPVGFSFDWEYGASKLRRSSSRLQVKRYLAIMANTELRKLSFGF